MMSYDNNDVRIEHLPTAGISSHNDPRDAEVQARTVRRQLVAGVLTRC